MVSTANWDVLGTWCEVLVVEDADLPDVAELARAESEALERAYYRPVGELASLASGRPQRISPELALALAAALRTAEYGDGLTAPELRTIALDLDARLVILPRGIDLDLVAATTRAWAADWIAQTCATELGTSCLVNLGGDIAVRGDVPDGGWQIEIDDGTTGPFDHPSISMGWPGGLATRTSTTGPWRTVTVAARSCERAGAAGSVAIRMGDAAPRWLTQRELPARLVRSDGVVVQTSGWPGERLIA